METTNLPRTEEFSLVKGGPTYRLMVRLGLISGESYVRMAVYSALFIWLPPFLLSLYRGVALGNGVEIPLLSDFSLQSRFLVALPLLILAEPFIDSRLRTVVKHFRRSNVLAPADQPRFESAIRQVLKGRDSIAAEAVILPIAVAQLLLAISQRGWVSLSVSSWYALPGPTGANLTVAGWWVAIVGTTFPFLLYRWLWRILLWTRFLWRVGRLELQLIPTHPDLAGGLAFVGNAHSYFGLILFAISSLAAGVCANQILLEGQTLDSLRLLIGVFIVLVVALFSCPVLVLTPILYHVKKKGLLDYGALAMEYVQGFRAKWLDQPSPDREPMLGSSDFQSLADLEKGYETVAAMRIVVLSRKKALVLLASAAAPFLPLLLTKFPLEELVKQALKMII